MILHYSVTHLLEPGEGPFRRLDARLKLATSLWILCLVASVSAGDLSSLRRLLSTVVLLVVISRVSWQSLVLRLLPLLPFLMLVVFIPFMHSGPELWHGLGLTVTQTGVERALEVGGRMLSMGLTLALLSATTPAPALLDSLRAFRVPASMVQTLEFLFRYLFLLLEESAAMRRAWRARGGEFGARQRMQLSLGALLASLFVRTYSRGERVFLSMMARGYQGDPGARESAPIPKSQYLLVGLVWVLLAVVRFVR